MKKKPTKKIAEILREITDLSIEAKDYQGDDLKEVNRKIEDQFDKLLKETCPFAVSQRVEASLNTKSGPRLVCEIIKIMPNIKPPYFILKGSPLNADGVKNPWNVSILVDPVAVKI